jgi:cytochrome b561
MKQAAPIQPYNLLAKILHWLILALLIVQYSIAWTMPDIHKGTLPVGLIGWHLSIGTFILLVVVIRIIWRGVTPIPAPPDSIPPSLQFASRITHFALYLILLVLPLMGWANASARGWHVGLFGVELPALVKSGSSVGRSFGGLHSTTAIILLVAIGLHVCAALYHQWILRDGLLRRMGFGDRRT